MTVQLERRLRALEEACSRSHGSAKDEAAKAQIHPESVRRIEMMSGGEPIDWTFALTILSEPPEVFLERYLQGLSDERPPGSTQECLIRHARAMG